jgi:hypothetical protein
VRLHLGLTSDRPGWWPDLACSLRAGGSLDPESWVAEAMVVSTHVVTVNDVLDGHVGLDIQCLDRIYLNAYIPTLQTSAQVAAFLSHHLGYPVPLAGTVHQDR